MLVCAFTLTSDFSACKCLWPGTACKLGTGSGAAQRHVSYNELKVNKLVLYLPSRLRGKSNQNCSLAKLSLALSRNVGAGLVLR